MKSLRERMQAAMDEHFDSIVWVEGEVKKEATELPVKTPPAEPAEDALPS